MDYQFHPLVHTWFEREFKKPTPPQKMGWPVIAAGKNCLILAPTGSGKTLAAFLWCINDLVRAGTLQNKSDFEDSRQGVHTLYISPLKALNNDINRNLEHPLNGIRAMADSDFPEIRKMVRTGDTPQPVRREIINKPPHILITTPESLYLLLTTEKGREIFKSLKYLIVDEIHSLSNNKRGVHLSLSLERLENLCRHSPQRIGLSATQRPLERIAGFLGGQTRQEGSDDFVLRPVEIIDAGQRKNLDVKVISPVDDFGYLQNSSSWPGVREKLYDLILEHRTTLIFVNMRAQTEKLARKLNEMHRERTGDEDAQLILPHHGSLSKEMRAETEDKLKNGEIPAVIATASLELGIDIGGVDLVVQLESTRTVTSAMQRVGRSGHTLKGVSKGRIIPLYASDVDDCLAITEAVYRADIEETFVPENCLDVLAQQITAEVASQNWHAGQLYNMFRHSYCYRNLPKHTFDQVVEMLGGKYADSELSVLQPRLNRDHTDDMLYARKSARLMALTNGGTIPDRGYYGVYLEGSNTRLGEMEEEFVFESRVGTIFFLGNNEWQITDIKNDRIVVQTVDAKAVKEPFWKGEPLYRDFDTSMKVAEFRRSALKKSAEDDGLNWLKNNLHCDNPTIHNLLTGIKKQVEHSGVSPDDQTIVAETFRDSAGERILVVHALFGARVNGAWVTAISEILFNRYKTQIQFTVNDDGFLIRLPEAMTDSKINSIFKFTFTEIKDALVRGLPKTPVFPTRFRMNAMRALLLQRSQPGRRIPLWLQRLRAADLLQTAKRYPDFPVITETYRDCLQDYFDISSLQKVIDGLHSSAIEIVFVNSGTPSPMCSALLFRLVDSHMYLDDHSYATDAVAGISETFITELIEKKEILAKIPQSLIREAESKWHFENKVPSDTEEMYAIVEKLEPLPANSKQLKNESAKKLIENLAQTGRIHWQAEPYNGWIIKSDKALFEAPDTAKNGDRLIRKILKRHGPVNIQQICAESKLPPEIAAALLQPLMQKKLVISGELAEHLKETTWCDSENYLYLYRKASAARRESRKPVEQQDYLRFLFAWHRETFADGQQTFTGLPMEAGFLEREFVPARDPGQMESIIGSLQQGNMFAAVAKIKDKPQLVFFKRSEGSLFFNQSFVDSAVENISADQLKIVDFLKENSGCRFADIQAATLLPADLLIYSLAELFRNGLVTTDNYGLVPDLLNPRKRNSTTAGSGRAGFQRKLKLIKKFESGSWYLISAFVVSGKQKSRQEIAETQADLLLKRHGILVKELYRRENGLTPWFDIFQVLKKREWQGLIRRGYFVKGLSGLQFGLPEVVDSLKTSSEKQLKEYSLINMHDPMIIYGGNSGWDLQRISGEKLQAYRSIRNHIFFERSQPLIYCENFAASLILLKNAERRHVQHFCEAVKFWLKTPAWTRTRKKIQIDTLDGIEIIKHEWFREFLAAGFEQENKSIVLWPSAV